MESVSKCPACETPLHSVAEMAAHKCARTGTDEQIAGHSLEQMLAAAQRAAIKPTPEKLDQDCRSIGYQLHTCWDGEVEFVVILSPKDAPHRTHFVSNCGNRQRLKELLRATQEHSRDLKRQPLVDAPG